MEQQKAAAVSVSHPVGDTREDAAMASDPTLPAPAAYRNDPVMTALLLVVAALGATMIYSDWYLAVKAIGLADVFSHLIAIGVTASLAQSGYASISRRNTTTRRSFAYKQTAIMTAATFILGLLVIEGAMVDAGVADRLIGAGIAALPPAFFFVAVRSFRQGEHRVAVSGGDQ